MTTYTLRDGTIARDPRLARLVDYDPRSEAYRLSQVVTCKKPITRIWNCDEWLDQGQEGACVGAGIGHKLIAAPVEIKGMTMEYARERIYWQAQREDEWEGGAYPGGEPFYEGTSVLAGVKVTQKLGWCDTYRWAFGAADLALGLSYVGPAILGLPWLEGMMEPDGDGYIHATGQVLGGHCILCRGIVTSIFPWRRHYILRNSWGRSWGHDGDCKISVADMRKLLAMQGEAVFLLGEHTLIP